MASILRRLKWVAKLGNRLLSLQANTHLRHTYKRHICTHCVSTANNTTATKNPAHHAPSRCGRAQAPPQDTTPRAGMRPQPPIAFNTNPIPHSTTTSSPSPSQRAAKSRQSQKAGSHPTSSASAAPLEPTSPHPTSARPRDSSSDSQTL